MALGVPTTSAVRALQLELKKIMDEPVEGFQVRASEDNMFEWQVAIFGPPGTLYEGGYFKVTVSVILQIFRCHAPRNQSYRVQKFRELSC